ncbi:MAG: lanthionine synthetase LanC family protein [Vulcanimicrobiaceae bacterium]
MLQTSPHAMASELRARALRVARALADRLFDERHAKDADDDRWFPCRSLSGSSGYALTALALAQATGESQYEAEMHRCIRMAAGVSDHPTIGLFDGMSGLRAVTALALALEPRYEKLLNQCDAFIHANIPEVPTQPESYAAYDLIGGWSGARLAQCVTGKRESDRLVSHLLWVLEDKQRWSCVHPVRFGEPENDIGMAHGVAGILATLALTVEDSKPIHNELARCAYDLADRSFDRNGLVVWPGVECDEMPSYIRAAWCYGSPGICAALYWSAMLLGDATLAQFALHSLEKISAEPTASWEIDEPNICHGKIGNALVFASVGAAADSLILRASSDRLVLETLDDIEANDMQCLSRQEDGKKYETFNELVGSSGVILALLTLTGDADASWMRLHGLQPIR